MMKNEMTIGQKFAAKMQADAALKEFSNRLAVSILVTAGVFILLSPLILIEVVIKLGVKFVKSALRFL